jgi:hypothetical protein
VLQNNSQIKDEPALRKLLSRMPDNVAKSFSDEQLLHLKVALGSRKWGRHNTDLRGTFARLFYPVKFITCFFWVKTTETYRAAKRP